MDEVIAAVKNVILVGVAGEAALLGQELATVVLFQNARSTSECVYVACFSHDFTHDGLRLKENSSRHGCDKKWAFYRIIIRS